MDGLSGLYEATDEASLLSHFRTAIETHGGTGFAVAMLPGTDRMKVVHHHALEGWPEHFTAEGYVIDCPVTARIARATRPFLWRDVRTAANTDRGNAVLDAATEFGLHDGMIVPVRTFGGFKGNVFVRIGETSLKNRNALCVLMQVFHSQLMTLKTPPPQKLERLSDREYDVLHWLAAGKSSEDVGDILGISNATVMFHYRNVSCRWGTLNRTQTVVEAIRRRALSIA